MKNRVYYEERFARYPDNGHPQTHKTLCLRKLKIKRPQSVPVRVPPPAPTFISEFPSLVILSSDFFYF